MKKFWIFATLAVALILLLAVKNSDTRRIRVIEQSSQEQAPTRKTPPVPSEVRFVTSDGFMLSASFWSSRNKKSPAIILVHQFRSNRHDFDAFVPKLLERGYVVLAYDTRGSGKSGAGSNALVTDFPKDIAGAVKFLKERPEVDPSRIAVIGASVGANVAFIASDSAKSGIKVAVALSPSKTGVRGKLLGNGTDDFAPRTILIASDDREKTEADAIFNLSLKPKQRKIYPGFGHGVELLRSNKAVADILNFLSQNL